MIVIANELQRLCRLPEIVCTDNVVREYKVKKIELKSVENLKIRLDSSSKDVRDM